MTPSNYPQSTAETVWKQLHYNDVIFEKAAEKTGRVDDAATIRIVIVLLAVIIATALLAFLSLYHRVSI